MLTIQTGPGFPAKLDRIIQTIPVIRAKDIPIAFGVNRILIVIHGITPSSSIRHSAFKGLKIRIPVLYFSTEFGKTTL